MINAGGLLGHPHTQFLWYFEFILQETTLSVGYYIHKELIRCRILWVPDYHDVVQDKQ